MRNNLAKHRERCERWPIERVEAKSELLLFHCLSLHDTYKYVRLWRFRRVRAIYDAKLARRDTARRQVAYDARWRK
ncbi:hypothetical protein LCGC14_1004200 [marine sediment metagenome]|uniref:Uncharacterized protein n=1 Tax=marine sediment metagenome TaxID=412755 RepID=A0A0F9R885_9ZZZZ